MVFRKNTMRRKRVFIGGSATRRKSRTVKRNARSLSLDRKKTKRTGRKVKSLSGNRIKSSSGNKRKSSSGRKPVKKAFKPHMSDEDWQKFREKALNESLYKKFHRSIVDKIMIMKTEREFTRHMLEFRGKFEKEHSKIWMARDMLDQDASDSVEIEKHMYIQDLHEKLENLLINMEKFRRMANNNGISFSGMVTHAPHITYSFTNKHMNDLIKDIKEWENMELKKLKQGATSQARIVGTVNSGRTARRTGRRSGRSVASSIKTMLGWKS